MHVKSDSGFRILKSDQSECNFDLMCCLYRSVFVASRSWRAPLCSGMWLWVGSEHVIIISWACDRGVDHEVSTLCMNDAWHDRTKLSPDEVMTLLVFCLNAEVLGLPRDILTTDIWHCSGFTGVHYCGEFSDGGCWRTSLWIIPNTPTVDSTFSDAITSALAEHAMDTMHKIAWEDTEVLASNPRPHKQCAAEAWHILHDLNLFRWTEKPVFSPLFTMDWSTDFLKVSRSPSVYMFVLVVYVSNYCTPPVGACI